MTFKVKLLTDCCNWADADYSIDVVAGGLTLDEAIKEMGRLRDEQLAAYDKARAAFEDDYRANLDKLKTLAL